MRIFLAIPHGGSTFAIGSKAWYHSFYEPLVSQGHDVHLFTENLDSHFVYAGIPHWLKARSAALTEKMSREFHSEHRVTPFDLFFGYLCNDFVDYQFLEDIRRLGVTVTNFSCNNIHQFHLVDEISKHVDYAVYSERMAGPKFAAIGARAVHMQMAANPRVYRPYDEPEQYDITFVGQRYANRAEFIAHLALNGMDVRVWGPRWKPTAASGEKRSLKYKLERLTGVGATHGIVSAAKYAIAYVRERVQQRKLDQVLAPHAGAPLGNEEMIRLYSQSRISIGFSTVFRGGLAGGAPDSHVRLRDFEAPMSGAFYLAEHTPEIEEYYELGKEIESYSSKDEMLDKARFFLGKPDARARIRAAGLARALKDHTWERRFERLLPQIGLA